MYHILHYIHFRPPQSAEKEGWMVGGGEEGWGEKEGLRILVEWAKRKRELFLELAQLRFCLVDNRLHFVDRILERGEFVLVEVLADDFADA